MGKKGIVMCNALVTILLGATALAFAGRAAGDESPASAEPVGQTQAALEAVGQTQAAADSAYRKQVVCKREPVVGTRISKEVCRTRAQTEAERQDAKEYFDRIQAGARGQSRSAN